MPKIAKIRLNILLPSSRHHLSYGDCLEDKRENIHFCAALCTTVVHSGMPRYEQFLQVSVGLGLGLVFVGLFRFRILCVFWFRLDYAVLVLFAFVVLGLVSSVDWLGRTSQEWLILCRVRHNQSTSDLPCSTEINQIGKWGKIVNHIHYTTK